jgi:type VI protein secretion system component VasF
MPRRRRQHKSKATTQRMTKIFLWVTALGILLLIIAWISFSNNSSTNKTNTTNQMQDIEAHSAELIEEAEKLESTLNELQFDNDIQVLRDQ